MQQGPGRNMPVCASWCDAASQGQLEGATCHQLMTGCHAPAAGAAQCWQNVYHSMDHACAARAKCMMHLPAVDTLRRVPL
jgi:hypothetical protein